MTDRPEALVTAPFRGLGLARLRELADVTLDPWIDQRPIARLRAGTSCRATPPRTG